MQLLSEAARSLWAKKTPAYKPEAKWLPLAAHMADAAQSALRLWNTWVPPGVRRQIASGISFGAANGCEPDIAANVCEPNIAANGCEPDFAEDAEGRARKTMVFLAAAHDLGKASPVFQAKAPKPPRELDEMIRRSLAEAGLPLEDDYGGGTETRHGLLSHEILRRCGFDDSVSSILGGHHGKPPSYEQLKTLRSYKKSCGFKDERWTQVQSELLQFALGCARLQIDSNATLRISKPVQALLCGLVILSDWIASDEELFPLVEPEVSGVDSSRRAEAAFEALALPDRWVPEQDWDGLYLRRFEIEEERPVQAAAMRIAQMGPGIMVIEAPMGEGKTEAALAAAEILASKSGRGGVYFALPTQATSDAMFKRVLGWIERFGADGERYSARLSHGKAYFSEDYRSIPLSRSVPVDDDASSVVVHEWLSGRKKGMLNDFVVGTIDHLLMAGLKQKHLVLRHLGLSCKVAIIDEAHAYDVYMNSYLSISLKWLGAYGVPVIVLSATLPAERRRGLVDAYLGKSSQPIIKLRHVAIAGRQAKNADRPATPSTEEACQAHARNLAYPLITYTIGDTARETEVKGFKRSLEVMVRHIDGSELADMLERELAGGGCAGVVANTVGRSQQIFAALAERFGHGYVLLLHARLLSRDRAILEQEISGMLGPPDKSDRPGKLIVVGTQVLEQSLDLDFDVLATDLCPMDLLLQRMGRLHRHSRPRPPRLARPACYVMGAAGAELERGAAVVYGKYLLMRTRALLPESIFLPDDIPRLVEGVYDEGNSVPMDSALSDEYTAAREKWVDDKKMRERSAKSFQIRAPDSADKTLIGWLDSSLRDDSEKRGEAAVRDGADSVEAIVIQSVGGSLHLLPWIGGGKALPLSAPDDDLARELISSSLRLPALFGGEWVVDRAIGELEEAMAAAGIVHFWGRSHLLKGALCLILDGAMEAKLCGYRLRYDKDIGLIHHKEA